MESDGRLVQNYEKYGVYPTKDICTKTNYDLRWTQANANEK